jgi:hypothetical protein
MYCGFCHAAATQICQDSKMYQKSTCVQDFFTAIHEKAGHDSTRQPAAKLRRVRLCAPCKHAASCVTSAFMIDVTSIKNEPHAYVCEINSVPAREHSLGLVGIADTIRLHGPQKYCIETRRNW